MKKIEEFVMNQIADITGMDAEPDNLKVSLRDNGADSLDIFQIASDVEEEFGVTIKDKINTGEDIVRIAYDQLKD